MAEVYPSDNELLDIISDTETGVEYIPTGTAPYYLHFRKLLYRLLLASKRGNDLRVFDEGNLGIGVKAGKFWVGMTRKVQRCLEARRFQGTEVQQYACGRQLANAVYLRKIPR